MGAYLTPKYNTKKPNLSKCDEGKVGGDENPKNERSVAENGGGGGGGGEGETIAKFLVSKIPKFNFPSNHRRDEEGGALAMP